MIDDGIKLFTESGFIKIPIDFVGWQPKLAILNTDAFQTPQLSLIKLFSSTASGLMAHYF
jgi:hypothetical protein